MADIPLRGESTAPAIPGVEGFSGVSDGTRGDTHSSSYNGVVGTNDGSGPIPAGTPGGNGVFGYSKVPNASGVFGAHDGIGPGVAGFSAQGDGTRGDTHSSSYNGVVGTNDGSGPVPAGTPGGNGVFGYSKVPNASGVFGAHDGIGPGVAGFSAQGDGTRGDTHSSSYNGVVGTNDGSGPIPAGTPGGNGVFGYSKVPNASGVFGAHDGIGPGVAGFSAQGDGTRGDTHSSANNGLVGTNDGAGPVPPGVPGGNGVFGYSKVPNASGVFGFHDGSGAGITGASNNGLAGKFLGDVEVTGDIRMVNADLAEDFARIGPNVFEPGTVMVLDDIGGVRPSNAPYDKRVAGVVSGAGHFKPAIILDTGPQQGGRTTIALVGKVFCKVDAQYGSVSVGDLLTTSPTCGHAMKVANSLQGLGSVIGKALRPLEEGQDLIPILISLQ